MKEFRKKFDKNFELKVFSMSVREQLALKFRLVKMFGDVLGSLTSAFTEDTDEDQTAEAIASIIHSVTSLDENDVLDTLVNLCEECYHIGKDGAGKIDFDLVFNERPMMDVYKVALWVLEVNYKDFFEGSGLLTRIQKALPT